MQNVKVGRGRGNFKLKNEISSGIAIGRGKFLMSPNQFSSAQVNIVSVEAPKGQKDYMKINQFSDDDPTIDVDSNSASNLSDSYSQLSIADESFRENDEKPKGGSNFETEEDLHVKSSLDTEVERKELEWQEYQFQRKVKGILKDINDENILQVVDALQMLVKEKPLSSRYVSCSESKKLISVLISKSVENDSFLKYGPCLLKTVAEHDMIQFEKYFYSIANEKTEEYLTLCASDTLLISETGERFCRMLGHMFTMPRQTSRKFFDIVSCFVDECIEKWTYPDGSGGLDGNLSMAMVQAGAVKHIVLEISNRVLSCDNVLMKRMEKFTWCVYESLFNSKLPRKLREIFLQIYVQLQTTTSETDIESESGDTSACSETDTNDVIVESEELIENNQDTTVVIENNAVSNGVIENNPDTTDAVMDQVISNDNDDNDNDDNDNDDIVNGDNDPYLCIKYLLHEIESEEYLVDFVNQNIDDMILRKPDYKKLLQNAGFETIFIFNLGMAYSRLGDIKCRTKALEFAETLMEKTETTQVERPSSRMAMNFSVKTPTSENKSTSFVIPHVEQTEKQCIDNSQSHNPNHFLTYQSNVNNENFTSINHSVDDPETGEKGMMMNYNIVDEEPHVAASRIDSDDNEEVIVEEEMIDNTASKTSSFLVSNPSTNSLNEHLTKNSGYDDPCYKVSVGRGRGFGLSKPVANVQPMLSTENRDRRKQQNWRNDNKNMINKPYQSRDNRAYQNRDNRGNKGIHANRNAHKKNTQKFQPIYHPKEKPQDMSNTFKPFHSSRESEREVDPSKTKRGFGFGTKALVKCSLCDNYGHTADNCSYENPFF